MTSPDRRPRIPRLTSELLEQDVYWRGADSRPYRLDRMAPDYRRNLLGYLERNAERLRDNARWLEALRAGAVDVDDAATRAPAEPSRELDAIDAVAWLGDRPLVRRLRELIDREDALDGEVVDVTDVGEPVARPLLGTYATDRALPELSTCPHCDAEYPDFYSPVGTTGTVCDACGWSSDELDYRHGD